MRLKAQPNAFPTLDISYASEEPVTAPVTISLPRNGLRLRFDGADQRLRLIEVLDFHRTHLTYKGADLVKVPATTDSVIGTFPPFNPNGPQFKQVYHKLFGPTFPGEYTPPASGSAETHGYYVLSYPGVAFSFPLQHSSWSAKADFVSLLSSSAASAAKSLSIFNGSSWKDARQELYTRPCPHPRSLALVGRGREACPDEIDLAIVKGGGRIELRRRLLPSFNIIFGETTPQDLVARLGPPDAIYRKNDRRLSIHKGRASSRSDHPAMDSGSPGQFSGISDNDRSSISTTTDYSSPEDDVMSGSSRGYSPECFYNYFHHGFDVFISYPSSHSPPLDPSFPDSEQSATALSHGNHLVATKILLHANVPGSYAFNRHRRSRWMLDSSKMRNTDVAVTSETSFSKLREVLKRVWKNEYDDKEAAFQRYMVLNRGWGDSPGSSCELLGGFEESGDTTRKGADNGTALGNTKLFGVPGLLFEVLKNDAVSCLTVY